MAKIDDITKLRPELLDKSDAELERLETEIKMARQYKAEEGARKEREAKLAEAGARMETVVDGLRWLNDNGFLSDKVKAMYTTAGGVFAAHLFFKKPKA